MDSPQPRPILQTGLRDAPWDTAQTRRLPGTGPVKGDDWLRFDEAFAAQMALRDRLIAERGAEVHALLPGAEAAAAECLALVLGILGDRPGFEVAEDAARRPDGVTVALDRARPLITLGRLIQDDICLLQKRGQEHVLTAAMLCFPASWTLAEKLGRPLTAIHDPIPAYDADIARRVQRLFDGIQIGRPIWRANCLLYDDASLFQPRSVNARRDRPGADAPFVRTERQCLFRLPETGAVVFSIHTAVLRRADMDAAAQAALADYLANRPDLPPRSAIPD
ncbi:MAG: DUF3445 domain-containing protein [Rhodobacter sp.]|nr:DUF3445 domain-containing protein [Rhodobacter sp.]